jgi:SAM-dependent methyltransferase
MDEQEQGQPCADGVEMYERYLVPAIFAPWADVLVQQAALTRGERVLDVACGTGVVARLAAQQVGPTGQVIGLDNDAGMLAVARRLTPISGASLLWHEGRASALPFEKAAFDVVLCQQGLQFFPDRLTSLREMHRVLVPGGRLVLSVWGHLEHCPGYAVLVEALEHCIGSAAASIMRAPFALGEASEVRALITGSQFRDIHLRTAVGTARFASPEQFVRLEMIPAHLASPVAQADESSYSALIREVSRALQPYMSRDGLAFPMEAHLVMAHT